MAKPLSASPPLTANGVDKMYHQLVEIHAITAVQLAECACCCRSDSTPNLVQGWDWPAKASRNAIHNKAGTITTY
jgi:hypothetical protein